MREQTVSEPFWERSWKEADKETIAAYDIKDVLKQCKRSATNGYRIASRQADNLSNTLMDAVYKVQFTVDEFNTSPM